MSPVDPKPATPLTPRQRRFIDAAVDIRENEPESEDKAFMTRYMVQATLPHSAPKGNPPTWTRVNGDYRGGPGK